MVLLIVDTQKAIMNAGLYQFDLFVSRVRELINHARRHGIEVIFVRHDDGPGNALTPGSDGFGIADAFQPMAHELIIDKQANSAFRSTGLKEHLRSKHEDTVIIAGLQTDYCIDATIKAGFEHGFRMIVPAGANSTFSNEYMTAEQSYRYHNELIWNGRYAECIPFQHALRLMAE